MGPDPESPAPAPSFGPGLSLTLHDARVLRDALASGEHIARGQVRGTVKLNRGNRSLFQRLVADLMFPSGPEELWFRQTHTGGDVLALYVRERARIDVTELLPSWICPC